MPRKQSETVPEGNGPIPQDAGEMIIWEELRRVVKETWDEALIEIKEDWRSMNQRLTSLEQDARQPRLAIEADGKAETKTRERTEGAVTAVQAMHGDSCHANRVDPDQMMCCTSFVDDCTGPPALPCSRENVLVDNGAAAPNLRLPPFKMRSPTATGGLLPTGEASIATRTTFNLLPLRLYLTEETSSQKPSTQSVSYDGSFFWKNNLSAAPSCRRVIETKSGQSRMFNPGGSRSFPCLPAFGNVARVALWRDSSEGWTRLQRRFLEVEFSGYQFAVQGDEPFTPYVLRPIVFFSATARLKTAMPSRAARGYRSWRDERRSRRRGRLEFIGCQGRSVVGERHGASSLTAKNSAKRLVTSATIPVFWTSSTWPAHPSSSITAWYADSKT